MITVIVEDEKPSARRLARLLQEQGLQVAALLHSVEEAVQWFGGNPHPQLIFLDIQLSDGLSFEIFDQVQVNSAIIFTTAYDEYALQAFKLNSVDYLLKPIDVQELQTAVEKYRHIHQEVPKLQLDLEDVRKLLIHPMDRQYKSRFTVKVGQHIKILGLDEIVCFYSENKGTYAATDSGRNYLMETTLESLEDELPPREFFRVNRKFFVHIKAIKDIVAYSNYRLKVELQHFVGPDIIVSRERVKDFKYWLS